jgi:hypothetical protein
MPTAPPFTRPSIRSLAVPLRRAVAALRSSGTGRLVDQAVQLGRRQMRKGGTASSLRETKPSPAPAAMQSTSNTRIRNRLSNGPSLSAKPDAMPTTTAASAVCDSRAGRDNQRRADIDQKLYAAAHVPGIDLHPAGAHLAQLQQHCRAFFLGHAREYQKAGGVRVARRNQHRMMGVSQSTHTCPLTASACAVFRQ